MSALAVRFRSFLPWQNFNEFFISVVYFVQGSGGIVSIAGALILREEFGLDFYQMGLIGAASMIPWSIKPLYGLLTDLVPIGGYRRRPYLHIGPLLAVAGYGLIALYAHDFASFLLPLVLANIGLGLTDVATDGFIVEQTTPQNAARLQGITQISIRVAAFITSFFSGLLVYREILTMHQMYLLAGALPCLTFACSFFIRESKVKLKDENVARQILSAPFIGTMLLIFVALVANLAYPDYLPSLLNIPAIAVSALLWGAFFIWMATYFLKLKKLKLTTGMIFIALLFILLWRFNPGAGSPMFFYLKDTLGLSEESLGFIDTASQVASVLAVILAVKYFDRFRLKQILLWTVIVAGAFGLASFAVTRPDYADKIGNFFLVDWLATLIALPVYFFESLLNFVMGGELAAFWEKAINLTPLENFLYFQSFLGELLFMLAYIPLLKLAVLITPKKAEATNYAVITSIMNIGLALSAFASGWLYERLRDVDLSPEVIDLSAIEILIWINIATSLTCLLVLPFLREREVMRQKK